MKVLAYSTFEPHLALIYAVMISASNGHIYTTFQIKTLASIGILIQCILKFCYMGNFRHVKFNSQVKRVELKI
jgi:hypothetical protein